MRTLLAFVSIVDGLVLFGSAGLILGPVTFAITRRSLEICNRRGDRLAYPGYPTGVARPGDLP